MRRPAPQRSARMTACRRMLAKQAGFEALYLSGAALSASMALPDLGLLTLEDVARGHARSCAPAACR